MSTESGPGFEAGLILMGSRSLPDRSQSAWIHYLAGVGQFAKFSKTLQVTIWEISENPLFRNVEENGKVVRIHMRTPINANNLGMCGIYFLFRFSFYSVWKTPFGSVNRQTDFFKDKESVYKSYWLCAVWRRRTTQWAMLLHPFTKRRQDVFIRRGCMEVLTFYIYPQTVFEHLYSPDNWYKQKQMT